MSYSTEPTPAPEQHSSHESGCAPESSTDDNNQAISQNGTEATSIDIVASTQDAGLAADVSVVNLDALGLLKDGIDADATANLLNSDGGDSGVEIALAADVGDVALVPTSGCDSPFAVGDVVGSLTDLSAVDVCSLTDHVGL